MVENIEVICEAEAPHSPGTAVENNDINTRPHDKDQAPAFDLDKELCNHGNFFDKICLVKKDDGKLWPALNFKDIGELQGAIEELDAPKNAVERIQARIYTTWVCKEGGTSGAAYLLRKDKIKWSILPLSKEGMIFGFYRHIEKAASNHIGNKAFADARAILNERIGSAYNSDGSDSDEAAETLDEDESQRRSRATQEQANTLNKNTQSSGVLKVATRSTNKISEQSADENGNIETSGGETDDCNESPMSKKPVHGKMRIQLEKQSKNEDTSDRASNEKTTAAGNSTISQQHQAKVSYVEKDSDAEAEDYYDSPDNLGSEVSGAEVTPQSKRSWSQFSDDANPPLKRRTRASDKKNTNRKGHIYYPFLAKWPPISQRMIANVGLTVLSMLREQDKEGWFSFPVAEMFPSIADDYSKYIKEPMDFHTIEEVQLYQYKHIHELQHDLILIFQNCCIYNGEHSEFFEPTIEIWKGLNEVFKDACRENNISCA